MRVIKVEGVKQNVIVRKQVYRLFADRRSM